MKVCESAMQHKENIPTINHDYRYIGIFGNTGIVGNTSIIGILLVLPVFNVILLVYIYK